MGPESLAQVLRPLAEMFPPEDYPALLVGLGSPDDAAVYRLSETQAIINTTDFFPPVVDDPYAFGQVAAANALSDVYAMGGKPIFAINLVAFPEDLENGVLAEILRGGAEKVREAGAAIAGGHTVTDQEPKYGLAVTGLVHPEKLVTKKGVRPGDVLVLTKPLGTGTLTTAHKRGRIEPAHLEAAISSMVRLNRDAARAAVRVGVHAMTDVTGFGLAGHAHEMAHLSGCALRLEYDALPWLPGVAQYASEWIFPGGTERNEAFYGRWVTREDTRMEHDLRVSSRTDWQRELLFDAQTSGGLLIAVAPEKREALLAGIGGEAWVIGEAVVGEAGMLVIGDW